MRLVVHEIVGVGRHDDQRNMTWIARSSFVGLCKTRGKGAGRDSQHKRYRAVQVIQLPLGTGLGSVDN